MRKSLYRRHNQVFLTLLRRYREQGKFRQRDLAQHLGSGQGTVSKAETGTRRLDVIELREWLLAMGVDFLEFMTELHERLEALAASDTWPSLVPQRTPAGLPAAGDSGGDLDAAARPVRPRHATVLFRPSTLMPHEQASQLAGQTAALAEYLLPLMRSALVREMSETLAELDNLQFRGQPLSLWIGHLGARNDQVSELLLLPGETEVRNYAHDLARLLLTNWLAYCTRLSERAVEQLMVTLSSDATMLPAEVAHGCDAFPLPHEQARTALVVYLLHQWGPKQAHR